MQKTPVSTLQEMMVKMGTVPHYELIHDGGGTHENTFTYQVSCLGLYATGTGRCKKDAKHLAANNMLETIAAANNFPALPPIPGVSPVRTMPASHILCADEPFVNAIGELQDLCAEMGLPDPIYETVGDEGPAHAKIFTIHCRIFTIVEGGRQTTKKHAKHLAARRMIDHVKYLIEQVKSTYKIVESIVEEENPYPDNQIVPVEQVDDINFIDFSKLSLQYKSSLGLKLSEFHTKLYNSYDDISRGSAIRNLEEFSDYYLENITYNNDDTFESYLEELKIQFNEVLSPLNIKSVFYKFPAKKEITPGRDICTMSITLNSVPELVECVIGNSEEKKLLHDLFIRIVKTLSIFLQK